MLSDLFPSMPFALIHLQAAAERQLAEQGAAAAAGADAANGDAGPEAKKAKLASKMLANLLKKEGMFNAGNDGGESSDEEEPSWELPVELQEYTCVSVGACYYLSVQCMQLGHGCWDPGSAQFWCSIKLRALRICAEVVTMQGLLHT